MFVGPFEYNMFSVSFYAVLLFFHLVLLPGWTPSRQHNNNEMRKYEREKIRNNKKNQKKLFTFFIEKTTLKKRISGELKIEDKRFEN